MSGSSQKELQGIGQFKYGIAKRIRLVASSKIRTYVTADRFQYVRVIQHLELRTRIRATGD